MLKKIFSGSTQGAKKVANLYKPSTIREKNWGWRIALLIGTLCVLIGVAMFIFSSEPDPVTPEEAINTYLSADRVEGEGKPIADKTGVAITAMTIHLIDSLQHKTGGYLSNDVTPPGILMDNVPSWEYGVLRNLRDISKVFRNSFATSGSQTKMDKDLAEVENKLSYDSEKWMLPSSESAYEDAARALQRYLHRIVDDNEADAQFYARADNLRRFFRVVSPNLGSYSQRLSESVGVDVENMALAGDKNATQTTDAPKQLFHKTPWYKIDNNFYEARGYAWALLQEVKALQIDFKDVLKDKNATVYVQQLIRELEATQKPIWSPVILNGDGFGVMTNHSQVMALYLSRADNILIQLSTLLERG